MPRNRKPFRHKWPKGWRPQMWRGVDQGPAKEFYEDIHPSVVRDRTPEVNTVLVVGESLGHTHAIFKAHPNCCPLCKSHNGRRQLLKTVLSWKYPLPHPNCWCTWETEKVVKKADMIDNASLLDSSKERRTVHVFNKAARRREHLTLQQGPSGKKRWMKTGEAASDKGKERRVKEVAERKAKKDEPIREALRSERKAELEASLKRLKEEEAASKKPAPKKQEEKKEQPKAEDKLEVEIPKEAKKELNDTVDDLREIKPGGKGKVRGLSILRHADGKRFKVEGVVAHGFKAAALMMMGIERVAASGGQWMGGSIGPGAEMAQGGQATKDIQTAGAKTTSVTAKLADKVRQRRAKKMAELDAKKKSKDGKKKKPKRRRTNKE